MKAMILAAGRGARLKPLTDKIPKPLLQVGPHCLIEYNLLALKRAGIEEVVINVCYHAKQIIEKLGDGKPYGLRIEYSFEEGNPLGTGGGIFQALPLLGDEPFILISSDVWSQYPFNPVMMPSDEDAHLVLVENPSFHPKGDYALSETGQVSMQGKKLTYSGIAKVHPRLFKNCEPQHFSISPLFNESIERGHVSGEIYRGPWFNVGTVEELERLKEMLPGLDSSQYLSQ